MRNAYLLLSIFIAILSIACEKSELENVALEKKQSNLSTKWDYPRYLTEEEKRELQKAFPGLFISQILVTGPPDYTYNCIAASLNIYDQWIDPPYDLTSFKLLYLTADSQFGASNAYTETTRLDDNADIDGWGNSFSMKHASRYHYKYNLWESKMGAYYRIVHPREADFSNHYGNIKVSFIALTPSSINDMRLAAQIQQNIKIEITLEEKNIIAQKVQSTNVNKEKFNELFDQWIENWKTNPITKFSNFSSDAKKLEEYPKLLNMGKDIIPILIEKLLDKKNFIGLSLYEDIQDDSSLKITYSNNDIKMFEGQYKKALRTIKLWIASNK